MTTTERKPKLRHDVTRIIILSGVVACHTRTEDGREYVGHGVSQHEAKYDCWRKAQQPGLPTDYPYEAWEREVLKKHPEYADRSGWKIDMRKERQSK